MPISANQQRRGVHGAVGTFVLILTLSGCTLSTPPSHQQIVDQALPPDTTVPPEWAAGGAPAAVTDDWLKSFGDPELDAVVAEALANNTDLRQAAAVVEIARQTTVVAGSRMMPQIGLNLGSSAVRDKGEDDWYTSHQGLGVVAWEADVWGRLRAQRASANASYQATALDYAYARQSLAAMTAKSWYQTTEALQLEELARESVDIHSRLLDLANIRRKAGKVGDLDVAQARADLNTARSELLHAQGLSANASRRLEILLGRYPSARLQAQKTFIPLPPPLSAGLPSALLERRPDLAAAQQGVVAAFRNQESAKLALLPSFALNLTGGKLSDGLLSLLKLNPWMFNASVGASVPIYTGGALTARIEIATAEQQQAVAAYGSAALNAFHEVESGLMAEQLLAQRLSLDEDALQDRTEAVRIATLQYQVGRVSFQSVLQLQEAQIATQRLVIQLRSSQLLNRIDLHLALGGGFDASPAIARPETIAKED